MKLVVRSREQVRTLDPDFRYLVISISDPPPDGEPLKVPQRWGLLDVLHLEFHDFDLWALGDKKNGLFRNRTIEELAMTADHAKAIWDFVQRPRSIEPAGIVIHCHAGVSRSPSVAMALADALRLDRSAIDWQSWDGPLDPDRRAPNWHVYRLTLGHFKASKPSKPSSASCRVAPTS